MAMTLNEALRQMIAVLTDERQALAGLDVDTLVACMDSKQALCAEIDGVEGNANAEDTRALIESAQRMNDVNRQIRNLVAANLTSRLDAIRGVSPLYQLSRRAEPPRAFGQVVPT